MSRWYGYLPVGAALGADARPGFLWRLLSPIGAVLLAFVLLAAGAGALTATSLSDDGTAAVLAAVTSLLLLVFGVLLWLRLPLQGAFMAWVWRAAEE